MAPLWATLLPAYANGEWEQALRICEEELERPQRYFHGSAHEISARIGLARGETSAAVSHAREGLVLGRAASDPQVLLPSVSTAAFALVAAGLAEEGSALADELLAHDKVGSPTPHFSSAWFDLSWVLVDLGRAQDLAAATARVTVRTLWVEAAAATAEDDYVRAAELYEETGHLPAAAYTRLRAARAGLANADLESAIAFFRKADAKAYLAEAEELATGSRAGPARARSTRRGP